LYVLVKHVFFVSHNNLDALQFYSTFWSFESLRGPQCAT
jgi:hypothetical protein